MGSSRKAFERVGKKQCFIMKTKTKIGAAIVSVVAAALLGGMMFSANASASAGGECRGPKEADGKRECQNTNTCKCSDMYNCKSKPSVFSLEVEDRMIQD